MGKRAGNEGEGPVMEGGRGRETRERKSYSTENPMRRRHSSARALQLINI